MSRGRTGHNAANELRPEMLSPLIKVCRSLQDDIKGRHLFSGVATGWTGVDMSTSLLLEVAPDIDTNPTSFLQGEGGRSGRLHLQTPDIGSRSALAMSVHPTYFDLATPLHLLATPVLSLASQHMHMYWTKLIWIPSVHWSHAQASTPSASRQTSYRLVTDTAANSSGQLGRLVLNACISLGLFSLKFAKYQVRFSSCAVKEALQSGHSVRTRDGTGSHFVTQRPSDPGIQRPGDPDDPVTLFSKWRLMCEEVFSVQRIFNNHR